MVEFIKINPRISAFTHIETDIVSSQNRIVFVLRGEDKWNPKYADKADTGHIRSIYIKREKSDSENGPDFINDEALFPGLSSTVIRKELAENEDSVKTIQRLMDEDKLNQNVGKYMMETLDQLPQALFRN